MAEKAKIRIAYTGKELDCGAMDINDLAPALMAYGNLITRVNDISKGSGKVRVQLSADSIRKGSFDVSLELVYEGIEQIKMFVGLSRDNGLADIMTVLGWGIDAGCVFTLIKNIMGRKISKIEPSENSVSIHLADGEIIQTPNITYNVYMDGIARKNIEKVLEPLKREGIDGFEIRNPDDYATNDCNERIDKSEIEYFATPEIASIENNIEVKSVIFRIVDLSFNDEHKWRLTNGQKALFWMKISDNEFLKEVQNGNIKFGAGDMLRLDYTNHQKIYPDGTMGEEYIITKVHEVIEKPTQIKLNLAD